MRVPDIKVSPPGPRARAIVERDAAVVSPSYPRCVPLVMARGEGASVEDVDGNVYLDFAAGIAVAATGHSHPDVVRAITDQASKFLHVSTDYYHEPQVALGEALAAIAPVGGRAKVFFSNSGTEAVEAAIKLARYHTRRLNIIAFSGSFHGRTLGSLSLTSSKTVQRRGFGPMAPGVFHAPYPNPYRCPAGSGLDASACARACLAYIEEQILTHLVSPDEVAAIFVEPIQGEGGYIVPPPEFLQGLATLCAKHGMLLVVDEVQSGIGRTGKMFAIEHAGVQPDIVIAAKGIASGLPMGVTIAREDVMDWPIGAHANTFGGNPVACAAALATLSLVQNGLMQNAATVGEFLRKALGRLPQVHRLVGDVRGRGLMIGIELVRDRQTKERATSERDALVMAAFKRGLLVLGAGANTIRLSPPLIITRADAETAVRILNESLAETSNS
jgi:4-aminobutyrate aminotransferase